MKKLKDVSIPQIVSLADVWTLSEEMPIVETLSVESDNELFKQLISTSGKDGFVPPQKFRLKSLQFLGSRKLTPLLRYLPDLKELKVHDLMDHHLETLAAYCKNLEMLEWMKDPLFVDRDPEKLPAQDILHRFLKRCPTLRVFNGIHRYIRADDFFREPWACQRIVKLRCRTVGVTRLTEFEQAKLMEDPPTILRIQSVAEKATQSQRQQRKVYDSLARLIHLKHLDLGFEYRDPESRLTFQGSQLSRIAWEETEFEPPELDTLELSLESGLSQLGALKNLEMFGFEGIDHRIGKKEIEWMTTSWPKLKLMYGLAETPLFKDRYSRKNQELRKHMEALRPDVVHGTLFMHPSRRGFR
ncbi:hypothetical protein BGX31_003497 [Mortierella sp. GBA43]|nr:hypothetical protein BGX31_003497 [Mortierella sp. GBA43]